MNLLVAAADDGPRAVMQSILDDTGYVAELEREGTIEALSRVENLKGVVVGGG